MNKYQIFCENFEGNYYSYFVKANSVDEAMSILWDKIYALNLNSKNYNLCVRTVK